MTPRSGGSVASHSGEGAAILRRWRRRRQLEQRARLADDAHNVVLLMGGVLVDAKRANAEVPAGVVACLAVWRSWAGRLAQWTEEGERQ